MAKTTTNKVTTVGQMREFAERQDARDDEQEERLQQLEEENDGFLRHTEQILTEEQKAQARANIGAAEAGHTHTSITTEEIDAILAT